MSQPRRRPKKKQYLPQRPIHKPASPYVRRNIDRMETQNAQLARRDFVKTLAMAGAGLSLGLPAAAQAPARAIKLGLDNFSVRAMNWKAPQLIDYAAALKTDSLFITDLKPFENFSDGYLKDLR